MRSLWRRLGMVALTVLAATLLVDWLWTSDRDRVVAALDEMESALEARDAARVAQRFAPDVAVEGPIPFLPSGRPLVEALAAVLAKTTRLRLSRDETKIAFPADGRADVVTSGTVGVGVDGRGGVGGGELTAPFHFELHLELEKELGKDGGERFLLKRVMHASIDPIGF